MIPVRDGKDGARLQVRIAPRARRSGIEGVVGEGEAAALKIAVQAPPVEGRANAALVELLAGLLRVPRSAIEVVAGEHARVKGVLVRGRTAEQVQIAIKAAMADPRGRVTAD